MRKEHNGGSHSGFRIGAVIPAAGLSSRMGAFKPLLPCGEGTVIESTVRSVLPYASDVVVVLGYRADEVRQALSDRFDGRVRITLNPEYRMSDMLRSVQIGLSALSECDGFFLLPGDMPAVAGSTFSALIGAFDGSQKVLYPSFDGRKGHPPLIHGSLIQEILRFDGGGGLRAALSRAPSKLIPLSDKGITADLDTPGDYAEMINILHPLDDRR